MIKAARKAAANAELARAFADIFTNRLRFVSATHMSTEQRKAAKASAAGRGTNVWSIAGAPERGAMRSLFIYVCEDKVMSTSMCKKRWSRGRSE